MDIDDLHAYDAYVHKPAREVVTVDTKIKPSNIGFAMLAKMGWQEGQPVGLSGDGQSIPCISVPELVSSLPFQAAWIQCLLLSKTIRQVSARLLRMLR